MQNLLKFFTILCLSSFLISCDGDDTTLTVTAENLQGEWELVTMNVDMSTTTAGAGVDFQSGMTMGSTSAAYTLSFGEDSWTTVGEYSYEYTINVNDTEQSDVATISDVDGSGSYQLDGNVVTISGAFFDFDFQGFDMSAVSSGEQAAILSFNGDGQLVFTQDEETEMEQSGISVVSDVKAVSVWQKK